MNAEGVWISPLTCRALASRFNGICRERGSGHPLVVSVSTSEAVASPMPPAVAVATVEAASTAFVSVATEIVTPPIFMVAVMLPSEDESVIVKGTVVVISVAVPAIIRPTAPVEGCREEKQGGQSKSLDEHDFPF